MTTSMRVNSEHHEQEMAVTCPEEYQLYILQTLLLKNWMEKIKATNIFT